MGPRARAHVCRASHGSPGDKADIDSALSKVDTTKLVLDSAGNNLCAMAYRQFQSLLQSGNVYLGLASAPTSDGDGHDAYAKDGKIHVDQDYLDGLSRSPDQSGTGSYHSLGAILLHEALHEMRAPGGAYYDHLETESYPYTTDPFSKIGACLPGQRSY